MDAFTTFEAAGLPIDIANCDTDQIIPARFLRLAPDDDDYARVLFHDLRFDGEGGERAAFIYNLPGFREARVVVANLNWGCGSSREAAVHALVANRFRAVIAPSFGDIHYNNCMKNGVLPVRLPREVCDGLRRQLHAVPGAAIALDLEAQTVVGPDGMSHGFEIDPFDKYRMVNGLDDIDVTLAHDDDFDAFEARHRASHDWLAT